MFLVVLHLDFPAALGLVDGLLHGIGHIVRVHDYVSVRITRGAADGLDQRGLGAEEALLVGVENDDQRDLGDIQALPEEVDADQHVEHVQSHISDDLRALQRVDIGVQVFDTDAGAGKIIGQILRHLLGQRRDKDLVAVLDGCADFSDQVVDLPVHRAHVDLGIQKSRRADDLLGPEQLVRFLVGTRRRAHEEHLVDVSLKFFKIERPVVQRRRQAEAIFHQGRLAGPVAVIHGADLGNGHMGLVHDDQKIVREEVHQGQRGLPRLAKVQMPGIVLNSAAKARLAHHLDVKIGALRDSLGLDQLVLGLKELDLLAHLGLNIFTRPIDLLLRDDVVGGRPDHDVGQLGVHAACQLLHFADPIDLVAEPLDADQVVAALGRVYFDCVPSHPEVATLQ